ncbi:MAG TPA: NAD(P)/FAD-dependent oxidoreductase [Burkholderiales bacterium]
MSATVVLGGGTDALVAAHLLARGGRRVTLLNEGLAGRSAEDGWVAPQIVRELGVEIATERPDPWASVLLEGGGTLDLWHDMGRTVESLRRHSPRDAGKWPDFCSRMAALARVFQEIYSEPPVNPLDLGLAFRVRRLGRQGMEDLMRVLPMPVAELLDDWFECGALKGALGAMGILHLQQGPRSAGTAFRLLHHHVGCPPGVFRPPRSNLGAVLRATPGIETRSAAVARINVRGGQVAGVVLASGEEIEASLVVSGIDPRRTLLELADPGWLDPQLARALTHIRRRGVAARVSVKTFESRSLVVAPSLDYLERAYEDVKHGRVSRQPYLEARAAGNGIEVHFQYTPYPGGGEIAELTRRLLPGLGDAELSVLGPRELEAREGWPEGQAYHAELALDQALWMRPLPELAHYRTPIEGLWLCGPGMHPGGGIPGAAGYNCARTLVTQLSTAA